MSRMSRRRFVGRSAAALGGLLAAACDLRPPVAAPDGAAAEPPPPPRGVPARANPPRTVQVLTWDEVYIGLQLPLAEEFTSRHPQLTVDWQLFPLTKGPDAPASGPQIAELYSAGVLFDVMQLPRSFTSHLFIGDAAADLHPFIRRDKYDLADYWPGAIEAVQWQRQLYGLHTEVRPSVLLLNAALIGRAGLEAPTTAWTWPQLIAAAKQLTDRQQPQPNFGFALARRTSYYILAWLWANGGTMLSADRSESLVAQPEAQEALQWLRDLVLTHEVTPREADFRRTGPLAGWASPLDGWDLFYEGRVAMLYAYWASESGAARSFGRAPQFSFATAEPPAGPRQFASFLDPVPGAYHLSKTARVPDDAWHYLRWWTSAETQRQFQAEKRDGFVYPPARQSLAEEFVDRYGAATLAALAYARPLPLHPKWYDLVQAYDQGLVPVWKGEQSVATATAVIASDQNAILAEWRRKQQGTP